VVRGQWDRSQRAEGRGQGEIRFRISKCELRIWGHAAAVLRVGWRVCIVLHRWSAAPSTIGSSFWQDSNTVE